MRAGKTKFDGNKIRPAEVQGVRRLNGSQGGRAPLMPFVRFLHQGRAHGTVETTGVQVLPECVQNPTDPRPGAEKTELTLQLGLCSLDDDV